MKLHGLAVLLLASVSTSSAQSLGDALNPALGWTTGGATPWEITTSTTHDGLVAAGSGLLTGDSLDSWLERTLTGPAAVNFWWKVSAIQDYSFLQLYIGGVLQAETSRWAGPWEKHSFYVPAGNQTVRWRFLQNQGSSYEQRGWLDEVSLSAPIAAAVVTDPTNQTVSAGETATLLAVTAGSEPLTFQWLKSGAPVASATNTVLNITNVQAANAGNYSIKVVNPLQTVTSQVALLTVSPSPPVFTFQPLSQGAPPLASATFSAAARGTPPITWQWYSNSVLLSGRTASNYTISTVSSNCYANYFVVAHNSQGNTTSAVVKLSYSPVFSWGDDTYGQARVPGAATNVIDLCGGDYHCLALRDDGAVLGWGANTWSDFPYNQAIVPLPATNAIAIAAGTAHSLAVLDDGTLLKWGQIVFTEWQDVPAQATNVVAVAHGTGAQHALALRADGTIVEWGTTNHSLQLIPSSLTNIVAVAAGAFHSLPLRADGGVVSWGNEPAFELPQVVPPAATNVVAIATGWYHNLALRADGQIVAWNRTSGVQVTNVPPSATNVVAIACGPAYSFALRRNGTFVAWGNNVPNVPAWLTNVALLACARNNALAILADGPPHFSGPPLIDRWVASGSNAFFYAQAVGATPLNWQWQIDGERIPGATNAWLAISNVQTSSSGLYSVVVSNTLGVVTNSGARLNVAPNVRILLSANLATNAAPRLSAIGQTGLVWKVEVSLDLSTWSELTTLTNETGVITYVDTRGIHPACFYRLKLAQ